MTEPLDRPGSLEIRNEGTDDASGLVAEVGHELTDFELDGSQVDRYMRGEAELHMHTRGRFVGLDHHEHCFVFQRGAKGNIPGRCDLVVAAGRAKQDWGNESVLVADVEVVKYPEPGLVCVVPSVVRLQSVNLCDDRLAHSAYLVSTLPQPHIPVLEYGELGAVGRLIAADLNELPGQVIQATSQIVENVADQDAPLNEVWQGVELDPHQVLSSIVLYIEPELVGFRSDPGIDLRLEVLNVFVCPVDLGKDELNRLGQGFAGNDTTIGLTHDQETYRPRRANAEDEAGL